MRIKSVLPCALLIIIAAGSHAQTAVLKPTSVLLDTSALVGVWRAQMDGLPAMTLTLSDETGSLQGAVLFYLLQRDPGKPVTATPGVPEPLMNLRFDGRRLTFQVSHRRAHPPGSLQDAPISCGLRLTGENRGTMAREGDGSSAVEVVRAE
jgi:hypothetical protein